MIPVKNINWVKQNNVNHNEWETLLSINKIILNLNNHNISQSANLIINKIDEIHPITCNIIIIQMICLMFAMKMNDFNIYLNFLNEIEMLEENNNIKSKIFDVFALFLLNQTQELDYLLDKLIEHNFLGKKSNHLLDIFKKTLFKKIPYFVHFMSEKELSTLKSNNFKKQIVDNYEELSKNNWELHKKFIEEGVNTNEIAKIIRNDEIEKLQEISSQNKFDFNQYILPSLYESYSFINQNNVSLIDYAAFFSAVKCFKYLLMNDTKVFNTGKYAVAGGNSEIIHLCEQNHSSFKDAYEAAIEFHRNDIFYYLYDKKIEKNVILENLGVICVRYHNYELFTFLQKEGMNVNDDIILESAKIGNLFFVKNFMKGRKFPTHILLFSLQSGNCELVKYLLEEETESNPLYYYDHSLFVAAENDFIKIVKMLLQKEKINVNAKDWNEKTALLYAAENGYTKIVKLLLEKEGIDVNTKDEFGYTALMYASKNGHTEIVKLLLEQEGIDVNAKDIWNGYTALMYASKNGHTEIVKLLLEQKGIDINAKDNNGLSAFICAINNNNIEIIKLFIEQKGIDINMKDKKGKTPLIYATENNHIDVVKLLLEQKGIDINLKDWEGNTAFINAVINDRVEIMKVFLEYEGIDITAKNEFGDTALMIASYEGSIDAVKFILGIGGIDINTKNEYGDTALMKATYKHNIGVVKLLLEQKDIDINNQNKLGKTVLMKSCENGFIELVKLFLDQKEIDINLKDSYGDTALMMASKNGSNEIVKLISPDQI